MATAREFDELSALYATEKNEEKKECLLKKMKENVFERNVHNDKFVALYTNKPIIISQAGYGELINVSHNLETMENRNRRDDLNNAARDEQLKKNNYSKDNPYCKQ